MFVSKMILCFYKWNELLIGGNLLKGDSGVYLFIEFLF